MQDIAKYFASVGFKIDKRQLGDLEATLKRIEKNLGNFASTFDRTFGRVQRGLAKFQMAQKRQLDIEAKQIRNATLQQKHAVAALKTQMLTVKAKADEARIQERLARATRAAAFGPSRSQIYKLRDQAEMKAAATAFGPSKSLLYRLRDQAEVKAAAQQTREAAAQVRFNWRSRRRVLDIEKAEEMAYAAEARKQSWKHQKTAFSSVGAGAAHWMRGFLPGFGAAWSLSSLNNISQELYSISNAMLAVTGSSAAASKEMQYLNSVGNEFGLTLRQIGPDYSGFVASAKGTKLEGNTQTGFRQFLKYTQVMGMSAEETKGSLTAIQQMMGKRKIMSEELKGQLAEHLRGAIPMMAEAAGMSVQELLNSSGKLDSDEVLPKFFALLERQANLGWEKYLKSSRRAQGLFRKEWEDTVKIFGEAGFDRAVRTFFQKLTDGFKSSKPLVIGLGLAFAVMGDMISVPVELVGNLIEYFNGLSTTSKDVVGSISGIIAVVLLLNTAFGKLFLKLSIIMLSMAALSDLLAFANGKSSGLGDAIKEGKWGEVAGQIALIASGLGMIFYYLSKIKAIKSVGEGIVKTASSAKGSIQRAALNAELFARTSGGFSLLGKAVGRVGPVAAIGSLGYDLYSLATQENSSALNLLGNPFNDPRKLDAVTKRNMFGGATHVENNPTFNFNIETDTPLHFEDYFKTQMNSIYNNAMLIFPEPAQ